MTPFYISLPVLSSRPPTDGPADREEPCIFCLFVFFLSQRLGQLNFYNILDTREVKLLLPSLHRYGLLLLL